ncbi:hypothetical protein BVI2075_20020 [Burkholderia vietnamiensis]|nr:hypothetical protein BVI2075_20020 [Burkholderia vietnamiensis]CAG9230306.1 hypothetical protein BVI1335_720015 [Burkholderia vietnamiensis]
MGRAISRQISYYYDEIADWSAPHFRDGGQGDASRALRGRSTAVRRPESEVACATRRAERAEPGWTNRFGFAGCYENCCTG